MKGDRLCVLTVPSGMHLRRLCFYPLYVLIVWPYALLPRVIHIRCDFPFRLVPPARCLASLPVACNLLPASPLTHPTPTQQPGFFLESSRPHFLASLLGVAGTLAITATFGCFLAVSRPRPRDNSQLSQGRQG
ncbi:hypothetical protein HDV57DRAFT_157347 [Trichoderma longibrachiatum]